MITDSRISYAIDNLFKEDYFDAEEDHYSLSEEDNEGKSCLTIKELKDNMCLSNFDRNNKCQVSFFRSDSKHGMQKRSDHVIFEHLETGWRVLIIEMKTSVGSKTWADIKSKTRATLLCVKFIAETLGIELSNVIVITTYENEMFKRLSDPTSPYACKPKLGTHVDDFEKDEWGKNRILVKFDDIPTELKHVKVHMDRCNDGVLYGELVAGEIK